MCSVHPGPREILIVGDSRVGPASVEHFTVEGYGTWKLRTEGLPGGKLQPLLEHANKKIEAQTRIIVIWAFHCDFTHRTILEDGKGLMHVHQPPNFEDLMNLVTTYDYQFRVARNLSVYWALPYIPDFVLYNGRQARFLGQKRLSWTQEKEAILYESKFREYVDQLARRMNDTGIHYVKLARSSFDCLRPEDGSDGVHLGELALGYMKYWVRDCVLSNKPMPLPRSVKKIKSIRARKQMKTHRHRNELRRKVKVAVAREVAKLDRIQAGRERTKPRRAGLPSVKSVIRREEP